MVIQDMLLTTRLDNVALIEFVQTATDPSRVTIIEAEDRIELIEEVELQEKFEHY